MLQYHQATFLPNNRFVLEACQQFFSNTILGQYYTQSQIDTKDCRIKTIEATMVNKALLLRRLAATGFTKSNLDWNLQYFCYPINERLLILTTSMHANGTQRTSTSSSGATRRLSSTTGRSPSRTIQIFILQ